MTAGRLRVPAYGGGSLADVLPAALRSLGLAHPTPAGAVELPPASSVCVVVVDGLGAQALRSHPDETPVLSSLQSHPASRTITSVFPTTTPIALTSLGTGLTPGVHGVTGFFLRLPDGRIVNTLATPAEVDMRALQPRPTLFERAAAAGATVTRIGPAKFDGNGLTQAALRGGSYSAAESVGERVAAVAAAARLASPALTYVYFGDLDATGHRHGCTSPQWREELRQTDRLVEQVADALPAGALLVVTSDHGMVDVPREARWDLAEATDLAAGVEALAGDFRGVHVHTLPGAGEDVLQAWRETLGDAFQVMTRAAAVAEGLYGPEVTDEVMPRIGDVVAAATGHHAVVDSRVLRPAVLALVGLHGSLTDDELLVPMLVHEATGA